MLKKYFKILAILLVVLTVISSFSLCFADEETPAVEATTSEGASNQENTEAKPEQEVHNGDLYLINPNVKMDKLVDGNVYIIGNNVEITGQVNGNLFILANSVKFDNSYVRYSIFVAAKDIYYNGACNDLYAATRKLEMTYESYVIRDVKAVSSETILKAAIGRDVDLETNSLNLGEENQTPIIYGNFRYSANEEKNIAEGIVEGEITYNANTPKNNSKSIGDQVKSILITFLTVIATAIIICLVLSKLAPNFVNNLTNNVSAGSIIKTCLKGLAILAVGFILAILLLISEIGIKLGFIVILALILICLFATPLATIYIAKALKPVLKIEKPIVYYVVLALIAIILKGITYIPYVGLLITCIIVLPLGCGLIVSVIWKSKELSEEEKKERIAKKEAAKALKEEKKAEKAKEKNK